MVTRREQQTNEILTAITNLSEQIELGGSDRDRLRQLTRDAIALADNDMVKPFQVVQAAVAGQRKGLVIKAG